MGDLKSAVALTREVPEHGYDFASLLAVEDRHFWFRARNRVISKLASQIVGGLPPGYRVLEVGCGNGNVLRHLEKACSRGTVVGMDLFPEGLEMAHRRACSALVQFDAGQLHFAPGFQLIGLFDVLEHLHDDRRTLADLLPMLAPGGALLLTVPAHAWLWSYFDEASQHVQRYELPELKGKLEEAGYRVEYASEYMTSIVPLMWCQRRLARFLGGSRRNVQELAQQDLRIVPVLNELLAFLLFLEARVVARRRRLPVGASLVAVARRPSNR